MADTHFIGTTTLVSVLGFFGDSERDSDNNCESDKI